MEMTTWTLGKMVEDGQEIFDFDYPFYSEERRKQFEQHFIEHFYFDEIGQETPSRFKHRLKIKLKLIMPYWNKIFLADELEQRILDNYSVVETYERSVENTTNATNQNKNNVINENNSNIVKDNTGNIINDITNRNLQSETPVTKVDFEQVDYFSNISKDIGKSTTNNTSNETNNITSNEVRNTISDTIQNVNDNSKESWTRKMDGNIGVQTDADAIIKYWQSLRQIEIEIFEQCNSLFMEVY